MLTIGYEGGGNWTFIFDDNTLNDGPVYLTTEQINEMLEQAPNALGQKCRTEVLDKGCEFVEDKSLPTKE